MYNNRNLHFFHSNEDSYILDCKKLIFCQTDSETNKYLKSIICGKTEPIDNSWLSAMMDAGYFCKFDPDKEKHHMEYFVYEDTMNISFAPIHFCNFNCKYCYAEGGKATKYYNKKFTKGDIDALINYIYYDKYYYYNKYKFDFVSGGEPLLALDILEYFFDKINNIDKKLHKQTTFFVGTNGSVLTDEILKILNKYNVFLGVSLDGPEKIHNKQRVYPNGEGTYIDVVRGINTLRNANISEQLKNAWAMCVVTNQIDDLISVMENSLSLGFKRLQMQIARLPLYHPLSFNDLNIDQLFTMYKKLIDHIYYFIKNDDLSRLKMIANNNDSFGKYLKRLLLRDPVYARCFAGKNKISITADGDVFPCDSFCGTNEFMLENIYNSDINNVNWETFQKVDFTKSYKCKYCWARYICGGDCYFHSYEVNGDIYNPDTIFCKISKFFIEEAIILIEKIFRHNPKHIDYLIKFLNKEVS